MKPLICFLLVVLTSIASGWIPVPYRKLFWSVILLALLVALGVLWQRRSSQKIISMFGEEEERKK